jgi:hypothetical protein
MKNATGMVLIEVWKSFIQRIVNCRETFFTCESKKIKRFLRYISDCGYGMGSGNFRKERS